MTNAARSADTRARLLEAAVEVFAEEGFRKATIHRICKLAGANIAAAHYHFGDKEGLYTAVFEYAERQAAERTPPESAHGAGPAERLRAVRTCVRAFLSRLLGPGRPAWIARLLARELIDPTPALDGLVRRRMRATHDQLADIVRAILGPGATQEAVRLCTLSVISQCVFYK